MSEIVAPTVVVTTATPALPDDVAVLDAVADPAQTVVAMLDRAKSWLEHASTADIPDVVDHKARAEAIRTYVAQRELGKDAELSAAEIVRRAERRIGVLIRQGQAEGAVLQRGQRTHEGDALNECIFSPKSVLTSARETTEIYAVTDDVSDEQFDAGLAEAKDEGNLSRANVVRKVKKAAGKQTAADKIADAADAHPAEGRADRIAEARRMAAEGHTSRQIGKAIGIKDMPGFTARHGIDVPADASVRNSHRHDANRIVDETVHMLAGCVIGLELVDDLDDLDPERVDDWIGSLADSLRALNKFGKQLKENAR